MDRRLVDHLVNTSLVTRATMQRHILRASKNKTSVGAELVGAGDLTEAQLAEAMATCYGHNVIDEKAFSAEARALKLISAATAERNGIIPMSLSASGDQVTVALHDLEATHDVLETLRMATGNTPTVKIGSKSFIQKAIRHYYMGEPWPDRPTAQAAAPARAPEPPVELFSEPAPPKRDRKPTTPPPTPPVAKQAPKKTSGAAQALEDFDAFLDKADIHPGAQNSRDADDPWASAQSGFPGFGDSPNASGFGGLGGKSGLGNSGLGSNSGAGGSSLLGNHGAQNGHKFAPFPMEGDAGFDLFEPSEVQLTLQETVDRQEAQIQRLLQDLQNQRDVLAVLVDMLVEARILNRKELTRLVKARRQ